MSCCKKLDRYTIGNWIEWFKPNERIWFWWGATVLDETNNDYFVFTVKAIDEIFLLGALKWLFLGSGAVEVIDQNDLNN